MALELHALIVGDAIAAWTAAGFRANGSEVLTGGVAIRCADDGAGADRWMLRTEPGAGPVPGDVDGLATTTTEEPPPDPVEHPNHVSGLDHLVLRSPDLDRTTEQLGALGLELRRTRDVSVGEEAVQQRFFRLGEVIIELVGPAVPAGDGPCRVWGLAFVSSDLDAAARSLGDACSPPKDAVQPGRRIATVRTRELGIGVTVALMSPHVRPPR